jgi:hypothetical protein
LNNSVVARYIKCGIRSSIPVKAVRDERCSGTLLSATLFLTAGHCTEAPAAHVEIWFDEDVESGIPANGYPFTGDVGGNFFRARSLLGGCSGLLSSMLVQTGYIGNRTNREHG